MHAVVCWRLLSVVVVYRRRLSSSVTLPAAGRVGGRPPPGRARGRSGGGHCTAGQYDYVPLGRHLVNIVVNINVINYLWVLTTPGQLPLIKYISIYAVCCTVLLYAYADYECFVLVV